MRVLELLSIARRRGVFLGLKEGKLVCRPAQKMSDLREEIVAHSKSIKRFLRWSENGEAVKVYSRLRGAEILIVADNSPWAAISRQKRHLIYSASELVELAGAAREEAHELHELKAIFKGMLIGDEDK